MKLHQEVVTLPTLAGGAAAELFQAELERTIANVLDPNTEWDKKRKIAIEVTITPLNEDRETADVSIQAKTTLAPLRPALTRVFMGKVDGQAIAVENDPKQGDIVFTEGRPAPQPPEKRGS